jgi:hypothetical protein
VQKDFVVSICNQPFLYVMPGEGQDRSKDQFRTVLRGLGTDSSEAGTGSIHEALLGIFVIAIVWRMQTVNVSLCIYYFLQGVSVDDIKGQIIGADGPATQATQADYVKFHDDKVIPSMLLAQNVAAWNLLSVDQEDTIIL